MSSQPPVDPGLLWVATKRYAAESLAELAVGPKTRSQLRTELHASRRAVAEALRGLASHGAVRRVGHVGSWDVLAPLDVSYELTAVGTDWADQLTRLDVWVAICERGLADET